MYGLYCDACDEPLLVDNNVRYVAKVEVYAAYDPLEITEEDLKSATDDKWRKLISQVEDSSEEELTSQVYNSFQYDLCPGCRKKYLTDPLQSARSNKKGGGPS